VFGGHGRAFKGISPKRYALINVVLVTVVIVFAFTYAVVIKNGCQPTTLIIILIFQVLSSFNLFF
jgi:hypothetical protein